MMQTWNSSLLTGIPPVDEQHKALFENIHFLQEQISSGHGQHVVDGILTFMDKYVAEHFELEEALMERVSYPMISEHKQEHRLFIGKSIRFELDKHADDQDLPLNMLEFFSNWLSKHIASSDMRLARYIDEGSLQGFIPV